MRTVVCCTVLLFVFTAGALAQDVPAQSQPPSFTADPIKGVWKLNVAKSKNSIVVPESEVITIVSQGSAYRITFDTKQPNGHYEKYDIVTEMKGAAVKPINADGKKTDDKWRVIRQGGNAFDMELKTSFGGWTDKYEISPDAKTMTLRRITDNKSLVGVYIEKNGTVRHPPYRLVFERVE